MSYYYIPDCHEIITEEQILLERLPLSNDKPMSWAEVSEEQQALITKYLEESGAIKIDGVRGQYYDATSNKAFTIDELMDIYEQTLNTTYFNIEFDDKSLPFGTTLRNAWSDLFMNKFNERLEWFLDQGEYLEIYDYE